MICDLMRQPLRLGGQTPYGIIVAYGIFCGEPTYFIEDEHGNMMPVQKVLLDSEMAQ